MIHKFKLFAQLDTDEPVLIEVIEARREPQRHLDRARIAFGEKWFLWLDQIPERRKFA